MLVEVMVFIVGVLFGGIWAAIKVGRIRDRERDFTIQSIDEILQMIEKDREANRE